MKTYVFASAIALSLVALPTLAAEPASPAQPQSGQQQQQGQQSADQQFIREQLGYCQYQIQSGQLIDSKSQDDKIKAAAREQVQQAQQSIQQWQQLATAQNIRPESKSEGSSISGASAQPQSPPDRDRNERSGTSDSQWMTRVQHAMLSDLSSKSGSEMDRCWTFQQAAMNRYNALDSQYHAKNAQSPEVKRLAQQMASGVMQQEQKISVLANSFTTQGSGATAGHDESKPQQK
jgi:uncharacterized protein (DUF305 family)